MSNRFASSLLLFVCSVLLCGEAAVAESACEALGAVALKDAKVTSARLYAAGTYTPPVNRYVDSPRMPLPAFCRVTAVASPTSDSTIGFEVWLPVTGWNGKFQQIGNGGLAGDIPLAQMAEPLLRGFAVAGTDDGHTGGPGDGAWAIGHPEKVIDYGYRAVHETAIQAKALIRAFYGAPPNEAYFLGCSDGGREALMEAQRFPEDFHGIVAGAPAAYMTHLSLKLMWDSSLAHEKPASYVPPAKLAVLQAAVVAECDGRDGVKDGMIEDPRVCRFDPSKIECKGDDAPNCLTAPQVEAVRRIYDPLIDPATGKQVSPGYSPGTENVDGNWSDWIFGNAETKVGFGMMIAHSFFADLVFENPKWAFHAADFSQTLKAADGKLADKLNATNPDLSAFKARGGKLIQFHGWGDPAIPAEDSIDYFTSVQAAMGDTGDFYRLFMAPGMSHCGGGIGATVFGYERMPAQRDADHDLATALDRWVVEGNAPEKIVATGYVDGDAAKGVAMTHPLCPYPATAHYKGSGDAKNAASFTCEAAAK